jgi:hypothetical protein
MYWRGLDQNRMYGRYFDQDRIHCRDLVNVVEIVRILDEKAIL